MTSFINSTGVTTVPASDVGTSDISPEIGITGTPVIDPQTSTLYVVAKTKEPQSSGPAYILRLHAINLLTGADQIGGVAITATVSGSGIGSSGGEVVFDPLAANQRAGLSLLRGTNGKSYVLIAFASHGNDGTYHGWLFAYDESNLSQTAALNVTPNGFYGGIWQSGAPPSIDANGNIYAAVATAPLTAALPMTMAIRCSGSISAQAPKHLPFKIPSLLTPTPSSARPMKASVRRVRCSCPTKRPGRFRTWR